MNSSPVNSLTRICYRLNVDLKATPLPPQPDLSRHPQEYFRWRLIPLIRAGIIPEAEVANLSAKQLEQFGSPFYAALFSNKAITFEQAKSLNTSKLILECRWSDGSPLGNVRLESCYTEPQLVSLVDLLKAKILTINEYFDLSPNLQTDILHYKIVNLLKADKISLEQCQEIPHGYFDHLCNMSGHINMADRIKQVIKIANENHKKFVADFQAKGPCLLY